MILKVTAINASDGKAISDVVIERESREACLNDAIGELLAQNNFPPEALAIYRTAASRDFTRDEICDVLLAKFHLQFFAAEATDAPVKPVEERIAAANHPNATTTTTDFGPNGTRAVVPKAPTGALSPRQLLRSELKDLQRKRKTIAISLKNVKAEYDFLTSRIIECNELLKPHTKPTIVRKRTETHG